MIPKKLPNIPDIEDMQKWWEKRKEILFLLKMIHNHDNNGAFFFQISDKEKLRMFEGRAHYILEALEPKKEGE